MILEELQKEVFKKIEKCYGNYGKYASFHEAMSVFREEFDELWDECRKKDLNFEKIENEIIDCLTVLYKMHQDIVIEENRR